MATESKQQAEDETIAIKMKEDELREAYGVFLKYHQPETHSVARAWGVDIVDQPAFPMFRQVDKTGVIFATSVAEQYGFVNFADPLWANMGQVRTAFAGVSIVALLLSDLSYCHIHQQLILYY